MPFPPTGLSISSPPLPPSLTPPSSTSPSPLLLLLFFPLPSPLSAPSLPPPFLYLSSPLPSLCHLAPPLPLPLFFPPPLLTFLGLSIHHLQFELVGETNLLLLHDGVPQLRQGNVEPFKRDPLIVQTALELKVNARHLRRGRAGGRGEGTYTQYRQETHSRVGRLSDNFPVLKRSLHFWPLRGYT